MKIYFLFVIFLPIFILNCNYSYAMQKNFIEALKNRAILGQVSDDGEVLSQIVPLYNSPLANGKEWFVVFCGIEGAIIEKSNHGSWLIEISSEKIRYPRHIRKKGLPVKAWVNRKDAKTLYKIMSTLTEQRKNSKVECILYSSPGKVRSGDSIRVYTYFRNQADTIKTVHENLIRLRNTQTAALVNLPSYRAILETKNVRPGRNINFSRKIKIDRSSGIQPGSYQLYQLYSLRDGPDGGMPYRKVSEFKEIIVED